MNQNRIKGHCKCGKFEWNPSGLPFRRDDSGRLVDYWQDAEFGAFHARIGIGYCHRCGYHLGDDGVARRTVVLPEEPIKVWLSRIAQRYLEPSPIREIELFFTEPYPYSHLPGRSALHPQELNHELDYGEKRCCLLIPEQDGEDE